MAYSRKQTHDEFLSAAEPERPAVGNGASAWPGKHEPVEAKKEPGDHSGEPPDQKAEGQPSRHGRSRGFLIGLFILLAGLAGFGGWSWWSRVTARVPPPAAAAAIPVDTAVAGTADVPVYLRGLGTVQAFNTVTIKARVDGQIQNIAFVEGQKVKRGDVLVQIDPRPYQAAYDQAVAKKAQDEAQIANARLDLQRYTDLSKNNYASRQQLDTQTALVRQLDATIRADQGAIDAAKVQLDYTTIISPIDGVAGIRLVDVGNIVHASDTNGMVVITQLQPISVLFTLPEEQRPEVAEAMASGQVQVAALARGGGRELGTGTVLLIDNQIDQQSGTMRLKATFPNDKNMLWPGQFVDARLLLKTRQKALTIPSAAVERGPTGFYAYVVRPDSTVDMRPLKVGQDDQGVAVIEEGLKSGERVVTRGQYRLQPGALVQFAKTETGSADAPVAGAKP